MLEIELLEGFEKRLSTIQKRPSATIKIIDMPDEYEHVISMYIKEYNEILFNAKNYHISDEVQIMASLFHESRHASQWHQVLYPNHSKEKSPLINQWKLDFTHNIQPLNDDFNYFQRSIEIDAIAFAHLMIAEIYKITLDVPIEIKDLILERQNQLDEVKNMIK